MALKIAPIDTVPEFAALTAKLGEMERRLAETRERRDRALALRRGAKSGRGALERALDLTRGGTIPATTPEAELVACDAEEAALRAGIVELAQQLESLRGDLSLDLARRLQAEHTGHLRDAVAAIAAMSKAFRAAAELRSKFRDCGYVQVDAVLPSAMPPSALALMGDGVTQLSLWKDYVALHSGIKL